MNAVKTAKQEALELLDKDFLALYELTRLHGLTAYQTGFTVRILNDYIAVLVPGTSTYRQVNYLHSVDDCLTLPLPDDAWWELHTGSNNPLRPLDHDNSASIQLTGKTEYEKTLPLAMLKAWWSMQE